MNFNVIIHNFPFLMTGLLVTLKVAFISIILSMLFGTILGVIRFAKIPLLSFFVGLFVVINTTVMLSAVEVSIFKFTNDVVVFG